MVVRVPVVERILSANDRLAEANRIRLDAAGVFAVNLMASPGAGKTSLILRTVRALKDRWRIAVLEGDLASTLDADRVAAEGVLSVQITTGGECHLDAAMVQSGMEQLPLEEVDLLLVENVGNLVCPAEFRLGVHRNVLIASVPEGDDKPYKYPPMYQGVDAVVLNKIDVLSAFDFNLEYFRRGVEALNPGVAFFPLSCKTGEGLDAWLEWLEEGIRGREGVGSKE